MTQYFKQLKFSAEQLQAMREMVLEHFGDVETNDHNGSVSATAAFWSQEVYDQVWSGSQNQNPDVRGTKAVKLNLAMKDDPRWAAFADLLPHMSSTASITRMPAGSRMSIHTDRTWRPIAIYFPIFGNTADAVSRFYSVSDLPANPLGHPQFVSTEQAIEVAQYIDGEYATLTNLREFHDVQNNSSQERMAFGWNFNSASLTYDQCLQILKDLGYFE